MKDLTIIIRKCKKGDDRACKALYDLFLPYCYGICQRYGVPNQEIKDVLQVAFSSMFSSISLFDSSKASFKTWFTRICINKIIEQRRSRYSNQDFAAIENVDNLTFIEERDSLDSQMDRDYILKILGQMPEKFQCVFNLYILDGYSHKEISSLLGISIGSSRIILNRGRLWAKNALTSFLQNS